MLHLPQDGELCDVGVSCWSGTTHDSGWGSVQAPGQLAGLNPCQGRPEAQKHGGALRAGYGCIWFCSSIVVTCICASCLALHSVCYFFGSRSMVKVGLTAVTSLVMSLGLLSDFNSVLGYKLSL